MTVRPAYPTDADVLAAWFEQHALETHVALPGRIQSYDPATQTADVVPQVRHPVPQADGTYDMEDLPVLPCVPVIFPRVGKWFLAMSVEPGDSVQLLFNSASISHWRTVNSDVGATGADRCVRGIADPGDLARQHLQNAVALVGLEIRREALRHAPPLAANAADAAACLTLGHDDDAGTRVSIYRDGVLKITRGADVVLQIDADGTAHIGGAAGDFLALAGLVKSRLDAIQTWSSTHTHTGVTTGVGTSGTATVGVTGSNEVKASKAKAT